MSSDDAAEEYERRLADFRWRWGFDPVAGLQSAISNGDYDLEGGTEEDRAFIREVLARRRGPDTAAGFAWERHNHSEIVPCVKGLCPGYG